MGSLTSSPQIPQAQQPVIVTIPAPPPAPVSASANLASAEQAATPAGGAGNEEAQRLEREDNLLRRSRGHLGTILTGFNGVLSDAIAPVRKTLLGE